MTDVSKRKPLPIPSAASKESFLSVTTTAPVTAPRNSLLPVTPTERFFASASKESLAVASAATSTGYSFDADTGDNANLTAPAVTPFLDSTPTKGLMVVEPSIPPPKTLLFGTTGHPLDEDSDMDEEANLDTRSKLLECFSLQPPDHDDPDWEFFPEELRQLAFSFGKDSCPKAK